MIFRRILSGFVSMAFLAVTMPSHARSPESTQTEWVDDGLKAVSQKIEKYSAMSDEAIRADLQGEIKAAQKHFAKLEASGRLDERKAKRASKLIDSSLKKISRLKKDRFLRELSHLQDRLEDAQQEQLEVSQSSPGSKSRQPASMPNVFLSVGCHIIMFPVAFAAALVLWPIAMAESMSGNRGPVSALLELEMCWVD